MLRAIPAIAAVLSLTACFADTPYERGADDPEKTAVVQANIQALCADGTLSFCAELTEATNGGPDVAVSPDGLLLTVGIHAAAEGDADAICHDLAAFHYDADAKDLGYTHVTVVSGGNKVADCTIP